MSVFIEGVLRVANGHLIRAGAIVPGLRVRNEESTLTVGPYTTVQGGIDHAGAVILSRGCVTWRTISGGPEVVIGADCHIPGDVVAKGRLIVQAGARVEGTLRAGGDIHLLGDCQVEQVEAGGDIVIVGSPQTGELQPRGRVRTRAW